MVVIRENSGTRFPCSEKTFRDIKAQNCCPVCTKQWRGFEKIINYVEKKRELQALEGGLKQGEGFKAEIED